MDISVDKKRAERVTFELVSCDGGIFRGAANG